MKLPRHTKECPFSIIKPKQIVRGHELKSEGTISYMIQKPEPILYSDLAHNADFAKSPQHNSCYHYTQKDYARIFYYNVHLLSNIFFS